MGRRREGMLTRPVGNLSAAFSVAQHSTDSLTARVTTLSYITDCDMAIHPLHPVQPLAARIPGAAPVAAAAAATV